MISSKWAKTCKNPDDPFYCKYNISWSGALILGPGCSRPTGAALQLHPPRRRPDELPCFWVKWCEGTDKFGPVPRETKHSPRGMSLFWRSSGGFLCTQLLSGCCAASVLDPGSTPFTAFLHHQGYATHAETIFLFFLGLYGCQSVSFTLPHSLRLLWHCFLVVNSCIKLFSWVVWS